MRQLRVLVADDHDAVRHMLRLRLQAAGCDVVGEAGTGEDAVSQARDLQPDVIVMDVMMPDMDGIEATRAIKREWPHIEIFGYSAAADQDQFADLLRAGATENFVKGDYSELVQRILSVQPS